jgi:hypothetical protein
MDGDDFLGYDQKGSLLRFLCLFSDISYYLFTLSEHIFFSGLKKSVTNLKMTK